MYVFPQSIRPALLPLALSLFGLVGALRGSGADHGGHASASGAAGEIMTEEKQDLTSPLQAYEWLLAGNERFRTGKVRPKDFVAQRKVVAHGQHPYATIVSCMDSRTSSEVLFDANLGDFFNIRIAGNIINDDILGSLEYAHKVAGAKLIVVLGHTHCGAVKGAADDVVMGNLTGLVARIRPAVAAIPNDGKPRNSKNLDFIDRAGRMNVILAVRQIRERSALLRDLQDRGQIDIVGGFYDLDSGRVEFYRPMSGSGPIRTSTTLIAPDKNEADDAEAKADEHGAPGDSHAPSSSEHADHGKPDAASAEPADSHGAAPEHSDHGAPEAKGHSTDEHATPAEDGHKAAPSEGPAAPAKPSAKRPSIVPAEESEPPPPEPEAHARSAH